MTAANRHKMPGQCPFIPSVRNLQRQYIAETDMRSQPATVTRVYLACLHRADTQTLGVANKAG